MDRRHVFHSLFLFQTAGTATNMNALNAMAKSFASTDKMPVLFLGHGSPMNALEENEFSARWKVLGKELPRPNAILCISAHWETQGTYVTAMEKPETIHDFGGFPSELFAVQYPAPGSPALAQQTSETIKKALVQLDTTWGLDHGCWSVVKWMYPDADIPVVQLSLNRFQPAQWHYELAKDLSPLRKKGVLVIGSGNMVHNLSMIAWDNLDAREYGFDWALEASEKMKNYILNADHRSLIDYRSHGRAFQLAIPTPEHFLPLLYALALQESDEQVSLFNDKAVAGSLTMTSVKIDKA
jgi:4,5-DOPA dioxygenase extradiol